MEHYKTQASDYNVFTRVEVLEFYSRYWYTSKYIYLVCLSFEFPPIEDLQTMANASVFVNTFMAPFNYRHADEHLPVTICNGWVETASIQLNVSRHTDMQQLKRAQWNTKRTFRHTACRVYLQKQTLFFSTPKGRFLMPPVLTVVFGRQLRNVPCTRGSSVYRERLCRHRL